MNRPLFLLALVGAACGGKVAPTPPVTLTPDPPPAPTAVTGVGGPCNADGTCFGALACTSGVCVTYAATEGQPCDDSLIHCGAMNDGTPLHCAVDTRTCAQPGGGGAACSVETGADCAPSLACVVRSAGDATGTCAAYGSAGAPCDPASEDCLPGLRCDPSANLCR